MKPPLVDYLRADSVADAVEMLAEHGEAAKALAGGQSLVPLLNLRLARPEVLVDINRLSDLASLEVRTTNPTELVIGALTRHRDLEFSPLVAQVCPVLRAATSHIGHFQIRNRGTVGGSLAHADPVAEIPLVATLLDATIDIRSVNSDRALSAEQFFQGYWTTALEPHELVTHLRLRLPPPGSPWYFREFTRRRGDFAIMAIAAVRPRLASGEYAPAQIAVSGLGDRPIRMHSAATVDVSSSGFAEDVVGAALAAGEIPTLDRVQQQLLRVLLDDAARVIVATDNRPGNGR